MKRSWELTPSESEFEVVAEGGVLSDAFGRKYVPCGDNEGYSEIIGKLQEYIIPKGENCERLKLRKLKGTNVDYFKRNGKNLLHKMEVVGEGGVGFTPRIINVEYRRDIPLGLFYVVISDKRAQKDPDIPESIRAEDKLSLEERMKPCRLESHNILETPRPRIEYPLLEIDRYIPITVPNKFSFSIESVVNAFTSHKKMDFRLLGKADFMNFLKISQSEAMRLRNLGYEKMFCFINFGKDAGQSLEHPHSQDGAIPEFVESVNSYELEKYLEWQKYHLHPFPAFFERIRDSPLFCLENESAIVMTPYAPKLPEQIDIYLKKEIGNLLEMKEQNIDEVADALSLVIKFYTNQKNISDFNMICHQTELSDSNSGYRMHFHLLPRGKMNQGQKKIKSDAGLEIGSGIHVIDVYPEDTAQAFRTWNGMLKENTK